MQLGILLITHNEVRVLLSSRRLLDGVFAYFADSYMLSFGLMLGISPKFLVLYPIILLQRILSGMNPVSIWFSQGEAVSAFDSFSYFFLLVISPLQFLKYCSTSCSMRTLFIYSHINCRTHYHIGNSCDLSLKIFRRLPCLSETT